jgi:hypothetical protein
MTSTHLKLIKMIDGWFVPSMPDLNQNPDFKIPDLQVD